MISVIGDIIIDEYIFGHTNRLSQEAPVGIINHIKTEQRPGGAHNVYNNIKSLTNDVKLCVTCENPPKKTRVYSGNHYITRIDYEGSYHKWDISYDYKDSDILVVSDYNKGCIKHINDFIDRPYKTMVDPKKPLQFYKNAWLIKPNRHEFEQCAGKWCSLDELFDLMAMAINNLEIKHLIVTLGEDGVAYRHRNGYYDHLHSKAVEVADICGAGDTFLATLAYAIHE